MKILLVHLSDMHFKSDNNSILLRKKKIVEAVQNLAAEANEIFIAFSGDIAFSGKQNEYENAIVFTDYIKDYLKDYCHKTIHIVIIPGNHDCNHEIKDQKIREALIKQIHKDTDLASDDSIITQCCSVQKDFSDFSEFYCDQDNRIFTNKLFSIFKYDYPEYNIIFFCYNTAWISQLDEVPGTLYFPIKHFTNNCLGHKVNLIISIFHHPLNWYIPENSRELRNHIERTSDILLTGHEHVGSKSIKFDLEDNYTEHIEGAVLQDWNDERRSAFTTVEFDLNKQNQKVKDFLWNGEIYSLGNETKWLSFKRSRRLQEKTFSIDTKFKQFLNDPGASYKHPNKSEILLDDIFVLPILRDLKVNKVKDKEILDDTVDSQCLLDTGKFMNKVLLIGAENSGKTTLCKILYKHYYRNEYVPIYIDGFKTKSTAIDDFEKLIRTCFVEQYSNEHLESFNQLKKDKIVIIIDDLHKSRLNLKFRSILVNNIIKNYTNIVITGNDLFQIEAIVYDEEQEQLIFEDFKQFEVLEFGHVLRSKLVNLWNTLGREEVINDNELLRKNDKATRVINTVIGSNIVPSYPIFLVTILQTMELGVPLNLKESSYGYYYDQLIIQSLAKKGYRNEDIDVYYNYMSELSYFFFKNKIREVNKEEFTVFHTRFCDEYSLELDFNELIDYLIKSSILVKNNNIFRFRYKYVFYYFVAKFLANHISENEIKRTIAGMSRRIYREEFANIIMFLTHLSKDPFILKEILSNGKSIFAKIKPIKFEHDISTINNLLNEVPKLVLRDTTVKEEREKKLQSQDEAKAYEKRDSNADEDNDYDIDEDTGVIDVISEFNLAFKTIEIIGQILKNYYGSLKGVKKLELGEEAYFIGLRCLNLFFSILENNKDYIVNEIKLFIKEKNLVKEEKIEEVSKKLLFHFCYMISYALVKKVSNSIGSDKLTRTFKEILRNNDIVSVNLIDISIKLDFIKGFPYNEIAKLRNRLQGNILPNTLLKRLVINYLYMFKTNYMDKQRICNVLDIPMEVQRKIDRTSTQKKEK